MANRSLVLVDLVVVAALVRLVAEEVDGRVVDAVRQVLLVLDVLQTVRLVPAGGKDVEGELAADGVSRKNLMSASMRSGRWRRDYERHRQIREFLLQCLDHRRADLVLQIIFLVRHALRLVGISSNRADIDHAIPELDECASLDRDLQIRDVVQDEVAQLLVLLLSDPGDEGGRRERHAHAVCGQAVLGEAEVEERRGRDAGRAELLLLLGEVGAADEANGDFLAQLREDLEDFGGHALQGNTVRQAMRIL